MASEDEIDQYEYFKNIAEDLGFSIWRSSGRFVLFVVFDKHGEEVGSFPNSQELCQFINGLHYGKLL